MPGRAELLIYLRRISGLFEHAFRHGPDGTLEGKFEEEHPLFIHHSCSFYLAGCLAFLEGKDGAYSWNDPGFDSFVLSNPPSPKDSYDSRGINRTTMNALAEIRNAVTHNNSDLAQNRNQESLTIVTTANIPGVNLSGSVVALEAEFLEFVRVATLAVRNYHGEN